jgi:ABC-type transporter Mla subunit MlaD
MPDRRLVALVGRLDEPTDQERARFRDTMQRHSRILTAAYVTAEALARAADQAAIYTRYGADVPQPLRDSTADLAGTWRELREVVDQVQPFL